MVIKDKYVTNVKDVICDTMVKYHTSLQHGSFTNVPQSKRILNEIKLRFYSRRLVGICRDTQMLRSCNIVVKSSLFSNSECS
jgi:hypothetical protein